MDESKLATFIERYVAMWHEPSPQRRLEVIRALFAQDAEDYTKKTVARGHDEIYARVTRAHEEWVVSKRCVFQPTGNTDTHHHLVKFFWKMLSRDGGPTISLGLDVFVLNDEGRIRLLYQFIEPNPQE